jgi:hypothetical protein
MYKYIDKISSVGWVNDNWHLYKHNISIKRFNRMTVNDHDQDQKDKEIYYRIIESGNLDLVKYVVRMEHCKISMRDVGYACKNGNIDIVRYLMFRILEEIVGTPNIFKAINNIQNVDKINWTDAYYNACIGNHFDIIKSLIQTVHNEKLLDHGFLGACAGGHVELAKLMIWDENDLDFGLIKACMNGHLNIVNILYPFNNNDMINFYNACMGGNLDIVKLMISKVISGTQDTQDVFDDGMLDACIYGHLKIVEFLISLGASDWIRGLRLAGRGGNITIVKLMISMGASNLNEGILYASEYPKIKKLLMSLIAK